MLDFIFLDILDTATMSPSAPGEGGGPVIESNTQRAAACVEAARLLAGQSSCMLRLSEYTHAVPSLGLLSMNFIGWDQFHI